MDSIPTEIYAKVIEHIYDSGYSVPLAQYAPISKKWKANIEQRTFKKLKISSTEFDTFEALFVDGNISRRAALKTLCVTFILPSPSDPGCCELQRFPDRDADSERFSASVRELFSILLRISSRTSERLPLSLEFLGSHRLVRNWHWCENEYHSFKKIAKAKAKFGQFMLINEDAIPTLRDVTSFVFTGECDDFEDLKPTWIPAIVERLLGLESLTLYIKDSYNYGRVGRDIKRKCLKESLCQLDGDGLRELRVGTSHTLMGNENLPVHKFVDSAAWDKDTWLLTLTHLASFTSLTRLHLVDALVVCPNIFRCISEYSGTPFPSLQELIFSFAPETADGRWFYQRDDEAFKKARNDPEYEDFWEELTEESLEEPDAKRDVQVYGDGPMWTDVVREDQHRTVPDKDTLLPLLTGAAQTVERLQSLKKFIMKLNKSGHQSLTSHNSVSYPFLHRVFELWYLKAGTNRAATRGPFTWPMNWNHPRVIWDPVYLDQNRVYWRVNDWIPWEEAQTAWRTPAGPDAKIIFLEETKWEHYDNFEDMEIYEGEF